LLFVPDCRMNHFRLGFGMEADGGHFSAA
jgi:hypothetical protein